MGTRGLRLLAVACAGSLCGYPFSACDSRATCDGWFWAIATWRVETLEISLRLLSLFVRLFAGVLAAYLRYAVEPWTYQ